jgi:hypothetical protein|tara:strand:+ start:2072 stop:2245 length:174 start_codon:yes stop_codon:yes gene_type:complete
MEAAKEARILGDCNTCKTGEIKYYSSGTAGIRFCDVCGVSTRKGDVVFTTREAALWK